MEKHKPNTRAKEVIKPDTTFVKIPLTTNVDGIDIERDIIPHLKQVPGAEIRPQMGSLNARHRPANLPTEMVIPGEKDSGDIYIQFEAPYDDNGEDKTETIVMKFGMISIARKSTISFVDENDPTFKECSDRHTPQKS